MTDIKLNVIMHFLQMFDVFEIIVIKNATAEKFETSK